MVLGSQKAKQRSTPSPRSMQDSPLAQVPWLRPPSLAAPVQVFPWSPTFTTAVPSLQAPPVVPLEVEPLEELVPFVPVEAWVVVPDEEVPVVEGPPLLLVFVAEVPVEVPVEAVVLAPVELEVLPVGEPELVAVALVDAVLLGEPLLEVAVAEAVVEVVVLPAEVVEPAVEAAVVEPPVVDALAPEVEVEWVPEAVVWPTRPAEVVEPWPAWDPLHALRASRRAGRSRCRASR
jgi:hypothetical protein